MLVVDANVLVYAVNEDAPEHDRARDWLNDALGGAEPVGFAWTVLLAFLRIATHRGVFARPLSIEDAAGVLDLWLAQPPAVVIDPTSRHLGLLRGLLGDTGTAGNLVNDAHIATLALEHGARLVSFDRDFQRFSGLSWSLP